MGTIEEIADEVGVIYRKVDKLSSIILADNQEIVLALRYLAQEVKDLQTAVYIAKRPDEESMRKSKMLREAYEQYEFVKNLVLHDDKEIR